MNVTRAVHFHTLFAMPVQRTYTLTYLGFKILVFYTYVTVALNIGSTFYAR
jgi:hypothetical protein